MKKNNFHDLEFGIEDEKVEVKNSGRIVQDFSGNGWLMDRMRPGQGVEEGIHLLTNELSGNNFSWNIGSVPGDVYTDLFRAGEIDDPIVGRNMAKIKWVQDYEWWYNYGFNVNEDMKGKQIEIVFEGVDYSCDVWLNAIHLGRHEGMMSSFKFDVTNLVDFSQPHVPSNLLTVKLDPPQKNQKNIAGKRHNFAGDYLTGLIPFGIWRPVKLIATDQVRIEDYKVESVVDGVNADVTVEVELLQVKGNNDVEVVVVLKDGENRHEQKVIVAGKEGKSEAKVNISLDNAKLWWPYELGESFLYDIEVYAVTAVGISDVIKDKVGIRQVEMDYNPGFTKEEVEFPWTFKINGKAMFLRSACWGGQPSFFYGRNNKDKYRFYLEKAKESNINNLRIFGWHPAEADEFYEICDELGITVWTNFPFATQVFREDEEYVQEVIAEAKEIVKDRRNHASVVMWMGGEEVYFSEAHVESGNRRLMERLGEATRECTNVPYGDASPLSSREAIRMGYKPKESAHANSHYYAAGAIFMEDYYPKLDYCIIPELTAASSPNVESLKKFIPENELWPMGLSWGYHAADIHVLQNLNFEVFGKTCMDSLEEFVEATQIAQGTILQYALEHFRRCKPHVSGVSLCHFITNWPIIKWDIIDYYGAEKKSFDYVKQSYQPLLPSVAFSKRRWMPGEEFSSDLYVINDYYEEYTDVAYCCEVTNETGQIVYTKEQIVAKIGENTSDRIGELQYKVQGNIGECFHVKVKLVQAGKVLSQNNYTLLIADQEKAKEDAGKLFKEMHVKRSQYGRGYYRYTPELVYELD